MKTPTLLGATIALATALLIAPNAYSQPCPACQPAVKTGFDVNSPWTVYLDPGLSTTEYNTALAAIDAWNQYWYSNGYTPPITITTNTVNATVGINEDPQLHGTNYGGAFNNASFIITLNPDYRNRTDGFMEQILIHELGHAMGFSDVSQTGCKGNTIMWWEINASSGPYMTSIGPADQCALFDATKHDGPTDPDPKIDWITTCETGCVDPLVLDLNGDGINTTGTDGPVWFDMDADGRKDHITWTNPNTMEGFLWVNLTGKNRVDNGSELFGIGTVMPDGSRAKDGFEALSVYDRPDHGGNGDGVIDERDAVFDKLRVWVDENHDGVCQPEEVSPIRRYGIEVIMLHSLRAYAKDGEGNVHTLQSVYFRTEHGKKRSYAVDSISFQRVE